MKMVRRTRAEREGAEAGEGAGGGWTSIGVSKAVKDALEADKPLILTLHKKSRNPLLQDIRRRDDVRILEVTPVNRNLLPYKIVKLMKGEWEA